MSEPSPDIPERLYPDGTIAVTIEVLAHMLQISRSMAYKMESAGQIGPTPQYFGKTKRYVLFEVQAWAKAGMPPRHEWVRMKDST